MYDHVITDEQIAAWRFEEVEREGRFNPDPPMPTEWERATGKRLAELLDAEKRAREEKLANQGRSSAGEGSEEE